MREPARACAAGMREVLPVKSRMLRGSHRASAALATAEAGAMARMKEEMAAQLAAAKAAGAMARMEEEMAAQLAAAKAAARHFFDAPFDLWRLPATGRSWRDGAHEGRDGGAAGGGEGGGQALFRCAI